MTITNKDIKETMKVVNSLQSEEVESPIDMRRVLQTAAETLVHKRISNASLMEGVKEKAIGILLKKVTNKLSVRETMEVIRKLDELTNYDMDRIMGAADGGKAPAGLTLINQNNSLGGPQSSTQDFQTYKLMDSILQAAETLQVNEENMVEVREIESDD